MTSKTTFQPVPPQLDFVKQEQDILNWWYQQGLIQAYLNRNQQSSQTFSFIDGPITANNPMGVHHARGRTLKDVFQRYKNSQGFKQRFQNGFDCQGLWVEVEVEKDAGFNSKKDILDFGLDKFTNTCVARVNKFAGIQTEQSKRLGMFMDWENSYYTMSETNNLYIWHFLKKVQQNGWLYQEKSATTWCPRCETGLSQHEQADGYKDITDTSVYLKFALKNRPHEFVLAWTTTPWTLSANVLLAINTNFEYVKAKLGDDFVYLARQAADRLGLTDYTQINPHDLLNLEYESLYHIPAQEGVKHYITNWDLVDPVEGTGVVHIAPGCGQEDFELGKQLGSAMIAPLNEQGFFVQGFGDLTGHYAHDVAPTVFEYLQSIGALYKTESITHRYPHCWRCKTKCLFRLENNWFIDCDPVRNQLKQAAKDAHWMPKYMGSRMQNWLDSMSDWMISRKRFYGLALPFYQCPQCHQLTVVGSKEELRSLAIDPQKVDQLPSLHRPWIDEITIHCPGCQSEVKRIPEVGDCWLDAGVVPFSTLKYLEDKSYWQTWFPADFVTENNEQIRLWYYSMLFFSVVLENRLPYLNVLCYGEVRDEKGERISKTKRNGIPYDQAVETMTADAMRWLYCQQRAHMNVCFGYNVVDNVKRNFLLILWNTYRFFIEHVNSQNFSPNPNFDPKSLTQVLDRWLLSRLHHTISQVTKYLDKFDTPRSTQALESFLNDLSTWYVRRTRDRSDNLDFLYYCLKNLAILLSPFIPYLSEAIYQNLAGHGENYQIATSVHLQNWPKANPELIDLSLHPKMELVREVARLVHAKRQKAQIKVRQPLATVTITTDKASPGTDLLDLLGQEINVKTINWQTATVSEVQVDLDTHLTPELVEEGEYRDLARAIQVLRKEQGLDLHDQIKITAPAWPNRFEQELLNKTLAVSIEKGPDLAIKKV
jgi:isoleucyl-tRNA synthetase